MTYGTNDAQINILLIIFIHIISSITAGAIANLKGKDYTTWFFIGLVTGLLGVILAPTGGRKCPYCCKGIAEDALVCHHCTRDLPQPERLSINDDNIKVIMNSTLERNKKIRMLADLRDKKFITSDQFNNLKMNL